jgi:hypothetical protein
MVSIFIKFKYLDHDFLIIIIITHRIWINLHNIPINFDPCSWYSFRLENWLEVSWGFEFVKDEEVGVSTIKRRRTFKYCHHFSIIITFFLKNYFYFSRVFAIFRLYLTFEFLIHRWTNSSQFKIEASN